MTRPTDEKAPAATNDARKPQLVLTFEGPGSAECSITPVGPITLAQLYTAAWLLDAWAREVRQASQAQTRPTVALPAGVQADLARMLRGN